MMPFAATWMDLEIITLSKTPLSVGFPGKNTGVGCHALLQGIFPTQGSNLYPNIAGGFLTI